MSSKIISIYTFSKIIKSKIKLNKINESLESIKSKIGDIVTEPSCNSIAYGSEKIDSLCNLIGEENLKLHKISIKNNRKLSDINYYIATKVLNSGGHSKLIANLINAKPDEKHCILLTGIRGKSDTEFFKKEMCIENVELKILNVPFKRLDQKLTWMQKHLSSENPKKVHLFNDHNDSVAVSSISKSMNIDCNFYHHADYKICLGVFSKNFKHIDVNNCAYFNCKNTLDIENYYVPCAVEDLGFRDVSNNSNSHLITCSVGGRNKIEEDYAYDNLKIIVDILKSSKGKHVHIGKLTPIGILKIKYLLFKNKISFKNFKYIKWTKSVWKTFQNEKIDLFIAPFPIVGGMTLIEALGSGIPIACHKNIYSRNLSGIDMINMNSFLWENDDELLYFISKISKNKLSTMSKSGRDFYEKYYSLDNFLLSLNGIKSCNIPELHDINYSINKDEYAFYLESRISLKNYIKRIVHRVLAYIISKI